MVQKSGLSPVKLDISLFITGVLKIIPGGVPDFGTINRIFHIMIVGLNANWNYQQKHSWKIGWGRWTSWTNTVIPKLVTLCYIFVSFWIVKLRHLGWSASLAASFNCRESTPSTSLNAHRFIRHHGITRNVFLENLLFIGIVIVPNNPSMMIISMEKHRILEFNGQWVIQNNGTDFALHIKSLLLALKSPMSLRINPIECIDSCHSFINLWDGCSISSSCWVADFDIPHLPVKSESFRCSLGEF